MSWLTSGTLPLSRQDAGYLLRETVHRPMHVVALAAFAPGPSGPLTQDDVRAHLGERLAVMPALRLLLHEPLRGRGRRRWYAGRDVDLDYHVQGWPSDDAGQPLDVDRGTAAVTMELMRRDRPLWQLRVSPPDDDGVVHVAGRIHHALADGGYARDLLAAMFAPNPPDDPRHRLDVGQTPPGWRLRLLGCAEAVRATAGGVRQRRPHGSSTRPATASPAAPHGGILTGEVSDTRRTARLVLPLSHIKSVARRSDATVNDVYLCAATAGLRGLLLGRGMAEVSELAALVPRDVRDESERGRVGNRTWSMYVPLPVGFRDPARCLAEIRRATETAKTATASAGAADFDFDVAVSNVVMRPVEGAVRGCVLTSWYATGPLQGRNRLIIVGLSYRDAFTVSFTADGKAFPDLDVLASATHQGFEQLFALVRA